MRRLIAAAALATGAVSLTACGGPPEPDFREVLQSKCLKAGGKYFEYEATSAGAHIWCVTADGRDIGPAVSEGDDD